MTSTAKPRSLYLHVPFCKNICFYCDFTHTIYENNLVDDWLTALETELALKKCSKDLDTIYIGGGTPSCLSLNQLDKLLTLLDRYTSRVKEYTLEVNPETIDIDKVKVIKKHGINRISMGFQTDNKELLKNINRHHTYEDVKNSVQLFKDHGIDNISLDILYSLPGQTMNMLKQTVEKAIALDAFHLSLYSLQIEENTVFGKQGVKPLDEETETDMYEWICKELPKHGYSQYEISNFSKPGFASLHNLAYWNYQDFYGISTGASGKEDNVRYDNTKNIIEYLKNPMAQERTVLSTLDQEYEMIMMGLRLKQGLKKSHFYRTFGVQIEGVFGKKINKCQDMGLLIIDDEYLACTKKGYEILNSVLVELMPEELLANELTI